MCVKMLVIILRINTIKCMTVWVGDVSLLYVFWMQKYIDNVENIYIERKEREKKKNNFSSLLARVLGFYNTGYSRVAVRTTWPLFNWNIYYIMHTKRYISVCKITWFLNKPPTITGNGTRYIMTSYVRLL